MSTRQDLSVNILNLGKQVVGPGHEPKTRSSVLSWSPRVKKSSNHTFQAYASETKYEIFLSRKELEYI